MWANTAYSISYTTTWILPVAKSFTYTSCKTRGQRVTIPLPRGRKSLPKIFSKTELFPLDCPPTTAIWGKSIGFPPKYENGEKGHTYNGKDFLNIINDRNQSLHSKITLIFIHCFI